MKMEMKMENTCIKGLSLDHIKKVVEYYKSLGIDTSHFFGGCIIGYYYGLFDGEFYVNPEPNNSKIIELPTDEVQKYERDNKLTEIQFELEKIIGKFMVIDENTVIKKITLEDVSKIILYNKFIEEILFKYKL